MDFDEIWDFIQENSVFFIKMSKKEEIEIDFDNRIYWIDGKWRADPFHAMMTVFRNRFMELGPSSDHEFTRMSKMASNHGIKLPITRKEYDEYIEFETKNQTVLYALEELMGAENYKFIIPSKEHANQNFRNSSLIIEQVLSDIFVYEGRIARYYVDIYDRLAGFEVFLENGSIFVPARFFSVDRCALYEDKLRDIDISEEVHIYEIDAVDGLHHSNSVFLSPDSTDSISNVAKYFRSFNISSDDYKFIFETVSSLKKIAKDPISITIDYVMFVEYYIEKTVSLYSDSKNSSVPYIIDIAKYVSCFSNVEKDMYLAGISSDIPDDIIDMMKPYIEGDDDTHEAKIAALIDDENIELCARTVKINGESSSIIFYNKRMKYFKEFNIDRTGIVNEFIPDIGGYRYISKYCGIDRGKAPTGHSSVDNYIVSLVTKVIHREFSTLPVFRGSRSSGAHYIGEVPVFATRDTVFGANGKHAVDGIIFDDVDIDVHIPKIKPTKRQVKQSIQNIVDASAGFVTSEKNEYEYFALMIASSVVLPFVHRANKFVATIVGANNYIEDGMKYRIFSGVMKNSRVINTDSDYVVKKIVDGSSSILVTNMKKSLSKVLEITAKERFGSIHSSRIKASENIKTTINTSPLFVFTDKEWLIDDAVIFNFYPRAINSPDSRLYDFNDESGIIAHYMIKNIKKIQQAEEKFIKYAKKVIRTDRVVDKNSYIDFFEKILPAMCLCEVSGFKDGIDFHNDMMSIFFNTSRIKKSIKIDKIILSIRDNGNLVEDKVMDSTLRMSQQGDTVYVDKAFHKAYVDNDDTDMFVFVFDTTKVYKLIKKEIDMSYVDFMEVLLAYDGFMNYDNAVRNWRLGSDKKKTVYSAYKDFIGETKDNFGAIRISRSSIMSFL